MFSSYRDEPGGSAPLSGIGWGVKWGLPVAPEARAIFAGTSSVSRYLLANTTSELTRLKYLVNLSNAVALNLTNTRRLSLGSLAATLNHSRRYRFSRK
jgi:hypothetical protein